MSSFSSSDVNNERSLLDGSNYSQQPSQQNILLNKKPSTEIKTTELAIESQTALPEPISSNKAKHLPKITEEKAVISNKIQDSS